jgi:hypothetical protein
LAVSEIHNLIYAYKAPRRYLVYDTLRGELVSLDVQLKEDCPLCSIESGISGIGDVEALPDYNAKPRAIPYAHECEILGSVASEFDGLSDDDVASHDHAWDVGYHSFRGH